MIRRRRVNGIEGDACSRWCKRYFIWRPGQRRYGKKMILQRERREAKQDIREQYDDYRYGIDPD